jgi:hypothetical protein
VDHGAVQIPFIFNFFWSIRKGEDGRQLLQADDQWAAPPPPHGNF